MTNFILTAFLAIGLFVVFYRYAVRPLLRSVMAERIQRYENMLEKMVSNGALNTTDFSYRFLKQKFQSKNHLNHITISGFLHFIICRDRNEKPPQDTEKFLAEASVELKDLHFAFCRDFLRWMVMNSPFYSLPGVVIIGVLMLYRSMNEQKMIREAFTFADIESNTCPC